MKEDVIHADGSCLRSSVKIYMDKKMTARIAMSRASALSRSVLWMPYRVSSDELLVILEGSLSISVMRFFGHTPDEKEAGLDNKDNNRKSRASLTYFEFASCVVLYMGILVVRALRDPGWCSMFSCSIPQSLCLMFSRIAVGTSAAVSMSSLLQSRNG